MAAWKIGPWRFTYHKPTGWLMLTLDSCYPALVGRFGDLMEAIEHSDQMTR